jgi:hypothetical protein
LGARLWRGPNGRRNRRVDPAHRDLAAAQQDVESRGVGGLQLLGALAYTQSARAVSPGVPPEVLGDRFFDRTCGQFDPPRSDDGEGDHVLESNELVVDLQIFEAELRIGELDRPIADSSLLPLDRDVHEDPLRQRPRGAGERHGGRQHSDPREREDRIPQPGKRSPGADAEDPANEPGDTGPGDQREADEQALQRGLRIPGAAAYERE